ncbi:MAG: DinB family protein [Pyrinomonadaceae bacterium]|nr:DinB family protein [Acidobacteriota bacterium]MBK7933285.1 DinB family protein [Acidobacteriota bacterium]MBP7374867.1 DinB family protein [Pyrinomonadaceae bacterium]
MIIETLKDLYDRDLKKLRTEIESYQDEDAMWKVSGEIPNSGGNLAMHLVGNLKHFIGTVLGDSGYVRQRDVEFSTKNTTRAELLQMIDETADVVAATLDKTMPEKLEEVYPIVVFADRTEPMTTGWFLVHLSTHLSYHLGQINYHRRLFDA